MGNEQSQQSQVDTESQHSQDEGAGFHSSESSSDPGTIPKEESGLQQRQITSPPRNDQITPKQRKRARKKKSRSERRRLSNSASTVTGESVVSDGTPTQSNIPTASDDEVMEDSQHVATIIESPQFLGKRRGSHGTHTTIISSQKSPTDNEMKASPSTTEEKVNAVVSATPSAQMFSPNESRAVVSKGGRTWYPCPEATAQDCKETFSMLSDARRHVQMAHQQVKTSQCFVCPVSVPEGDAFRIHMAKHSAEELRSPRKPISGIKLAESSAAQAIETSPSPHRLRSPDGDEAKAGSSVSLDEQEIPESISHAELSKDVQELHIQSSHEEMTNFESVQAIPDSQLRHVMELDTAHSEESHDKTSGTPDSGFDEPLEQEIVQETPRVLGTLKRRRDIEESNRVSPDTTSPSKRPRRSIFSPPRSSSPEEFLEGVPAREPTPKPKLRSLRSLSGRSGNLESFAKPIAPGSQLYHPIHNPRTPKTRSSQRVQVVIPRTSKPGPSNTTSSNKLQTALSDANLQNGKDENVSSSRPQKTVYTSPKGKRRAEPDIDYSTPTKHDRSRPVDNDKEDNSNHKTGITDRSGIATSIARRTTSQNASKKPVSSRRKRQSEDDDEPSSSDSDADTPLDKEKDTSKTTYVCQECQRRFGSLDALREHEKKPDVHNQLHKCEQCPARFVSAVKLSKHQSQTGHGDGTGDVGRKGHFSQGEINKLHAWRDRFCDEYDLDLAEFNQIMTDTRRRTKGTEWPHRFITKGDFLQYYLDTLPSRSRRSMLRYRERSFENVPDNQKWTDEDDDELVNLIKEIGPKWVEIGQRMTRTSDSVNQRWRHKLKYRGKAMDGEWLPQETELLVKAVNQLKRESSLSLDPTEDVRIPWDLVSNKLKGQRTAQQCSNKWRLMHTHKQGGKRIRTSGVDRLPNTPAFLATPSKMSKRIAGSTPQTATSKLSASTIKKRKQLSNERVKQSSEEATDKGSDKNETEGRLASNAESDGSDVANRAPTLAQKRRKQSQFVPAKITEKSIPNDGSDEDQEVSPILPRNPLSARTPRNGISVSQLMDQTQANTSVLRGTTKIGRQTQAERPSPNIPIQHRPESSPLRMISKNEIGEDEVEEPEASEDEESDEEEEGSDISASLTDDKAPETSASDEEQEDSGKSESATDTNISAEDSDEESDEDSDGNARGKATSQRSFLQSLRSPQSENTSKPGTSGVKSKPKKIDLVKVVRGGPQESPSEEESDSDSDDNEGDIMYRS